MHVLQMTPTLRRLLMLFTALAVVVIFAAALNPVSFMIQRLVQLLAVAGAWGGLLALLWKRRGVRAALLVLPLLAGGLWLLPARRMDTGELRADYVARLRQLESVPYFWGGESPSGIDCSGLPRRALRDALISRALRHADAGALREFAHQWMFDASALALSQGHRGFTRPLGIRGRISEMDYRPLLPGDLAVTESGNHVLVFLGGEEWAQAEPGLGRVVILNGHHDSNSWHHHPVTLHRWSVLF